MKIRKGFISNSSSSSFIVAFPNKPISIEEVQKLLFGDDKMVSIYNHEITTRRLAEIIFSDIKQSLSKKKIQEELSCGTPYPSYKTNLKCPKFPTVIYCNEGGFDWEKYHKEVDEWAKLATDDFIKQNPDAKFYQFEYEDHSTEGSVLEHGGVFNALPHIQMSHH